MMCRVAIWCRAWLHNRRELHADSLRGYSVFAKLVDGAIQRTHLLHNLDVGSRLIELT
jgi:hypothetical protein